MAKYRLRNPEVVDAIKWDGKNLRAVTEFIEGKPVNLNTHMQRVKWDEYRDIVKQKGLRHRDLSGVEIIFSIPTIVVRRSNGGIQIVGEELFDLDYELIPE